MLGTKLGITLLLGALLFPLGAAAQERIYGSPADPADWPSFVAFSDQKTDLLNNCAGVLVTQRLVLTAPHGCMSNREDDAFAYIGASSNSPYNGIRVGVEQVYHHPRFSNQAFDWALNPNWNIGLVRLKRPVSGVPLPQLADTKPTKGSLITMAGLGNNTTDGSSSTAGLLEASVEVVGNDICQEYMYDQKTNHPSFFCAWSPETGPCKLDGGTGAFQGNRLVGVFNLIWDHNENPFCPAAEGAGIYTAVAPALPWIQQVMSRGYDRGRFLDKGGYIFPDREFNPYVWTAQEVRSPQMSFSEKVSLGGGRILPAGKWIALRDNPFTNSVRANYWMFRGRAFRQRGSSRCLRGKVRATFQYPHQAETLIEKFKSCPEE